jgi:phytanoyl-CoA hydroxylase
MMQSAELISHFERDGCARVRGFFDPSALSELRRELARYVREVAPNVPPGDRTFEADGTTFRNLWRMEQHDPFFAALPHHAPIPDLVKPLVHGVPVLMGVETFNKPARIGSGVPPHQDNAYFCQSPPDVLTIWIAMDAATEANGPVCYLKASHRAGMQPHRASGVRGNSIGLTKVPPHEESDVFRGTLEPGDALVHHCQTIHWSLANRTDQPRCGLLMVFRGAHTTHDAELKRVYDGAQRA